MNTQTSPIKTIVFTLLYSMVIIAGSKLSETPKDPETKQKPQYAKEQFRIGKNSIEMSHLGIHYSKNHQSSKIISGKHEA